MSEEMQRDLEESVKPQTEDTAETQDAAVEKTPEVTESMDDYAAELEESYKSFANRNRNYDAGEDPNASKWQEFVQMQEDKTVVKVKIKEAVKGGLVAYLDEIRAFIPASQISVEYVENLEDWQGKYLEAVIITADPESKKLVLSGKTLQRERQEEEKKQKMAQCKAGAVVVGTVDSIKPYGAFVDLENGLTGLLHISQISTQRIKHPGVVLKEGQRITVKILSVGDGKISLSMRALEQEDAPRERDNFEYKESGSAVTGLGDLLKGLKL